MELADMRHLECRAIRCAGSNPVSATNLESKMKVNGSQMLKKDRKGNLKRDKKGNTIWSWRMRLAMFFGKIEGNLDK